MTFLLDPYRFAAPSGADYATEVLADSPAGYWRLGESAGPTASDSSGNGRNGTYQSTPTFGQPGATSDGNTAVRFTAAAQHVTLTRIAISGSITYEAFVKTTSTDATSVYAGDPALPVVADTSGGVWMTFGVHNGKVRFVRFNGSAWQTVDGATSVNDGNWHHIAATYDSSTRAVKVYVDGVEDGSGTITAHQAQGGVNLLARGFDAGDPFDGTLDEIAVYSSVLSGARIAAHYAAR